MASLTIRKIDDQLKSRLRMQAAQHGRSMEEEVRSILRTAVAQKTTLPAKGLGTALRARFAPVRGMKLQLPPREPIREPPAFD